MAGRLRKPPVMGGFFQRRENEVEIDNKINLQADVFNTALCGDIIIKSNGKTCDITVEKFYDEQQAQAA